LAPSSDFSPATLDRDLTALAERSDGLDLHDRLVMLLRTIGVLAPAAKVLVLGYTRWFPVGSTGHSTEHFSPFEQNWINDRIALVDGVIRDAAVESGVAQYVDVYDALDGHELSGTTPSWPVDALGNAT
jgi:hypothetical protein